MSGSEAHLNPRVDRRAALEGVAALACFPTIARAQDALTLDFVTIADPDGWHDSLRLKGDWQIFAVSDGRQTGYGEASHSRDDAACRAAAARIFDRYYRDFSLSLTALRQREADIAALSPDFIDATAFSGLNQALYDLLAKREGVPVWRLFADRVEVDSVALYTTINRTLETRVVDEYLAVAGAVETQGFSSMKCAPFEAVTSPALGLTQSLPGFFVLRALRSGFPELGLRVDFHERFAPADFLQLLPDLEPLRLDWIEEPFGMGTDYEALQAATKVDVAGGELFWGLERFTEIAGQSWVDVIMPDVKHVGGFGPLLDVIAATRSRVRVSPHNPSGPVSSAASLHAAVLNPDAVAELEFAFDRHGTRAATGERAEGGRLYLQDRPGWGVEPVIA